MTGAEHYAEAERLIAKVVETDGTPPGEHTETGRVTHQPWVDSMLALAQTHATLALAGVHAVCTGLAWHDPSAAATWRDVLGIAPSPTPPGGEW